MLVALIQLVFIFLFIRQIIIFLIAWWTGNFSEVPFHATNHFATHAFLSSLKKHAGPKPQVFMELGSGSGRISLAVAQKFPFKVIGIEKNKILYRLANFKKLFLRKKDTVEFRHESFFETDLSKANILYLYIIPEVIEKLIPKLESETNHKTLIFSWRFPINSPRFKLVDSFKRQYTMFVYRKR